MFIFFKQRTAYEMRISDWSSDVCSSDLFPHAPKAAEVLTLAIHELATNAAKYGAIRAPAGEIAVHWRREQRDGQDWLEIEWRESGVEIAPEPNRRKGFGTELITRRVPYELKGHRKSNRLNSSH